MTALKTHFSPREVADAIGVSESSLRRWADKGQLHIARTAGGHRRILRAEAVRFVLASGLRLVRPDLLGLTVGRDDDASAQATLTRALADGDKRTAAGVLTRSYLNGEPLHALFDGLLHASLAELGRQWLTLGDRGIAVEHQATMTCYEILQQLSGLIDEPADDAPRAVGGQLDGDEHVMPSLMVSMLLRQRGLRAINLGARSATGVLLTAVDHYRAQWVWRSVSSPIDEAVQAADFAALAQAMRASGGWLLLGGKWLDRSVVPADDHVRVMTSMTELDAFIARHTAA